MNNFFYSSEDLNKMGIKCGDNCQIHSTAVVTNHKNLILKNNVRIDAHTLFVNPSKIIIGNFIKISPYCYLHATDGASIELKDHCGLSSGVKIYSSTDNYSGKEYYSSFNKKKNQGKKQNITISKYTIIGSNSVVIPHVQIGDGVVIAPFSIVVGKLDSWHYYKGLPLKKHLKRKKLFLKQIKNY